MRFSELLKAAGLDVRPSCDVEVLDVQFDSRRCRKGSCFVAVRGWADDGHKYIPAAVAAGASAVVCCDAAAVAACNGSAPAVATLADTREALGLLSQAVAGFPARKLTCVGLTGTNGKTTTAHLVRWLLEGAGHSTGMLGTISFATGKSVQAASATTPDPVTLAGLCSEMVSAGNTHLVMEVSSHALHQRRTAGMDFAVGVFTNLTGDHLDYHKTMADYQAAKATLFESLGPGATAVINADDPAGGAMAAAARCNVTMYGLDDGADLRAKVLSLSAGQTVFEMHHRGRAVTVNTPMIGRHNISNCLAAAGTCLALGMDLEAIAEALGKVRCVPGRLERVGNTGRGPQVFVDYAHTDDALENVLSALGPLTPGRLIVVFGCGGDRDRTKRPRMARVAQRWAHSIVVTSDNPRSEDPRAIIDEILAGFGDRSKVAVEPDRSAAIASAIASASQDDVVLIAGKGHENYQILGSQRLHFDDVEEAKKAIGSRR